MEKSRSDATINVKARYEDLSRLITCTRKSMISTLRQEFDIPDDHEMCLLQLNKQQNTFFQKTPENVEVGQQLQVKSFKSGTRSKTGIKRKSIADFEFRQGILKKLKDNELLSDQDRRCLYEHIDSYSNGNMSSPLSTPEKVKRNSCPVVETSATSVQVKLCCRQPTKSMAVQTDISEIVTDSKPKSKKSQNNSGIRDITELIRYMKCVYHEGGEDPERVRQAMGITYPERRNFILSDKPPTVTVIRDTYPYLFTTEQVVLEFERIIGASDVEALFRTNLKKYSRKIIDMAPTTMHIVSCIKRALEKEDTEDGREYVRCCGALYILPGILKEDAKQIIRFRDKTYDTPIDCRPIIMCESSMAESLHYGRPFRVIVEQVCLCDTKSAIQAFLAFLASFYIFNIIYTESCTATLTLMEALFAQYTADLGEFPKRAKELYKLLKRVKV